MSAFEVILRLALQLLGNRIQTMGSLRNFRSGKFHDYGQHAVNHENLRRAPFKPDWSKHAKAAPFRPNDEMFAVMPSGVIVFPGSGITDNLRDKARRFGINVWELKGDGA